MQQNELKVLGQDMGTYEDVQDIQVDSLMFSGVRFNENFKEIYSEVDHTIPDGHTVQFDFNEGMLTFWDNDGGAIATYKLELDEQDVWLYCPDHNVDEADKQPAGNEVALDDADVEVKSDAESDDAFSHRSDGVEEYITPNAFDESD